jgi:hypothetical protein
MGEEMKGVSLRRRVCAIPMTTEDKTCFIESQRLRLKTKRSLGVPLDWFDGTARRDTTSVLETNIGLESRGGKLISILRKLLKKDRDTNVLVLADDSIGGGVATRKALDKGKLRYTWLELKDWVQCKNENFRGTKRGRVRRFQGRRTTRGLTVCWC